MNKCFLLGRISSPIFFAKTMNRVDHVRFFVAVNNYGKHTDFIPVIAWANLANYIRSNLTKGSLVYIEGFILNVQYFQQFQRKINSSFVVEIELIKTFSIKKNNSITNIFIETDVVDKDLYVAFDNHLKQTKSKVKPFKIPEK